MEKEIISSMPEMNDQETGEREKIQDKELSSMVICEKCGNVLEDGQDFCPKCGTEKIKEKTSDKQSENFVDDNSIDQSGKKMNDDKRKSLIIVGGGLAVLAVILLIVVLVKNKFDFNKKYPDLISKNWCTIASDGTWMELDTNPSDMDKDDFDLDYFADICNPCLKMIKQVNEDLGFSSSVYQKMGNTVWAQGRQSESNDEFIVNWTYHPDKGLEVMYEVKKK